MSAVSSLKAISRQFAAASILAVGLASVAQATVVEVQTNLGNFQINLFDFDPAVKPTVDNFLKYVEGAEGFGLYQNILVHRSVKDFVVQAGGYTLNDLLVAEQIKEGPIVLNTPVYSNVEGTVAMAKGNAINSATSQWFVNMKDNSLGLDVNVGGYTVFGAVTQGMDVVKEINQISIFNMGSIFQELPLIGYTADDVTNKTPLSRDNFVVIENIIVVDTNPNSAASLNPVLNKRAPVVEESKPDSKGASGAVGLGLFGLLGGLFGLGLFKARRRSKN